MIELAGKGTCGSTGHFRLTGWLGGRAMSWGILAEIAACWLVCTCFSSVAAPDVNETHYLTRAKHFWNSSWCEGDFFLESADAQYLFFFLTGWLAQFVSLEVFAWIGRLASWLLWSGSFVFVCRAVGLRGTLPASLLVLFLVLNRSGHLAGEWAVGGFEAKSIAWPLVLFALGMVLRGRWSFAWLLCSAAALLHLVVGWWGIVGCAFTRVAIMILEQHKPKRRNSKKKTAARVLSIVWDFLGNSNPTRQQSMALLLVVIVVAACFWMGAWPMLRADSSVTGEQLDYAARIQVMNRLPHHLVWAGFSTSRIAGFGCLLLVWLLLIRRPAIREISRLRWFVLASLATGFCGLLLSAIAESNGNSGWATKLLRLYWFRTEDIVVPLAIALEIGQLLKNWSAGRSRRHRNISKFVVAVLLIAAAVEGLNKTTSRLPPALRAGIAADETDPERIEAVCRNWLKACQWCREQTAPGSHFLTPLHQQSFHWYAGRAEFAAWKNAPQDAIGLIEWQRRVSILQFVESQYPGTGVLALPEETLRWIVTEYGIDFLMVYQRDIDRFGVPPGMVQAYPMNGGKTTFCILKVESGNHVANQ